MKPLDAARASRLKQSQHETIVNKANPLAGYTAVYKSVTDCTDLSDGAYRTYTVLLGYDYHNGRTVFPGLDTLAKQRGVTPRTIRAHVTELRAAGLLVVERRGLGLTNEYTLPDASAWTPAVLAEWKKSSGQQRSGSILPLHAENNCRSMRKKSSAKERTVSKKEQTKKEEGGGADAPRARSAPQRMSTADDESASPGRRLALQIARKVLDWRTCRCDWLELTGSELQRIIDDPTNGFSEQDLIDWTFWLNSGADPQTDLPYWRGKGYKWSLTRTIDIIWTELNDWHARKRPESKPDPTKRRGPVDVKHLAYVKANGGAL